MGTGGDVDASLATAPVLPKATAPRRTLITDDQTAWFNPTSLADVFQVLATYKDSALPIRLAVGNTSIGVVKYYPAVYGNFDIWGLG